VLWHRFGRIPAQVRDISELGVGLDCAKAIEPGTRLLFRLEPARRHVRARVIHATPVRDGWHVGCVFAEPLAENEVSAYVGLQLDPEADSD
jgi:hypothetical protein